MWVVSFCVKHEVSFFRNMPVESSREVPLSHFNVGSSGNLQKEALCL